MSEVLFRLIGLGNDIGTVTSAMMYDNGFITVDGETKDGKNPFPFPVIRLGTRVKIPKAPFIKAMRGQ